MTFKRLKPDADGYIHVLYIGGPFHGCLTKRKPSDPSGVPVTVLTSADKSDCYRQEFFAWEVPGRPQRRIECLVSGPQPDFMHVLDTLAEAYRFGETE